MRQQVIQIRNVAMVLSAFLLVGFLTRPLEEVVWQQVRARSMMDIGLRLSHQPMDEISGLGQGIMLALAGGFRSIVADLLYIQGYTHWERKDAMRTEVMLRLACEIEPDTLYFWLNYAYMVGYDFAIWRVEQQGGFSHVPLFAQTQWKHEAASQALAILDRAECFHPDRFEIPLAKAQLYMHRLQDREQAAHWFNVTAGMVGAPDFAARLHAQLLFELDRD